MNQQQAYRYWGNQKPPKTKAEFFNAVTTVTPTGDSTIATIRMYGPIDSWGGFWGISAKDVSGVLDALPFADQPRADDRLVVGADPAQHDVATVELLAQSFEALDGRGLQTAIGQFLDPIGEPAFEETPIVRWRLGVEEFAPLLLEVGRRRGLQCG